MLRTEAGEGEDEWDGWDKWVDGAWAGEGDREDRTEW